MCISSVVFVRVQGPDRQGNKPVVPKIRESQRTDEASARTVARERRDEVIDGFALPWNGAREELSR